MHKKSASEIVYDAISQWKPTNIVLLYSGGYDSQIMVHIISGMDIEIPTHTISIDTNLAADGWAEYVAATAKEIGAKKFSIYDNKIGFDQYVEWVKNYGCPRNITGHNRAYTRLKGRAIDAIHMIMKIDRHDKTLFLSGMRKFESTRRENMMIDEINRAGTSNKIFANPLFWWTDEDCARYRIKNDLPDNPFYSTVKGSGDCQCNWGNFITLGTLEKFSPDLAKGNVSIVNELSMSNHGYGWDGKILGQLQLFDPENIDDASKTNPFLCSNCSRDSGQKMAAIENVMIQRGIF